VRSALQAVWPRVPFVAAIAAMHEEETDAPAAKARHQRQRIPRLSTKALIRR